MAKNPVLIKRKLKRAYRHVFFSQWMAKTLHKLFLIDLEHIQRAERFKFAQTYIKDHHIVYNKSLS